MKSLVYYIREILITIGVLSGDDTFLDKAIALLIIVLVAILCDVVCRRIALFALHIHAKVTGKANEESSSRKKLLSSSAAILPAIVINLLLPIAFAPQSSWRIWIERMCNVYILVMITLFLCALLDFIYRQYMKRHNVNLPINILFQIAKYILVIIAVIVGFSVLLNKSPYALLTGVGASAAILSLVFKDSLVGLVSGMQLLSNKMLNIGDWITVPNFHADGIVKEITLNTVKIENFDNTTITIPPTSLLNGSFQNWRSMQESGARRVKRSINIDLRSIRFCSPSELEKYKNVEFLKPYIEKWDRKQEPDSESVLNHNAITNLTLFTIYLEEYIRHQPTFVESQTHMIRQLQPTENGLPLEIYFFTSVQKWEAYEKIQTELLDYVLAAVNYFDLSVAQRI